MESRPTKNDGEIISAAGVTRPQIPGTYWTSTPRWQALRSCIFVYGLLSLLFTKVSLFFFEILFYFLFIHIATPIFVLPRHAVPYIVNMDRNFVLFCWVQILEPLLRFYSKLWHKIGSRVEISEPQ